MVLVVKGQKWIASFLVVVAFGAAGARAEDVHEGGVVGQRLSDLPEGARVREWTAQEMRDAVPYVVELDDETRNAIAPLPQLHGPPQSIEAVLPGPGDASEGAAEDVFEEAEPELASPESGIEPQGYAYPPPYTRFKVFGPKKFPFRAVGKLFFTQNGVNYVCSASSIGGYAIITAGHCVHAGSGGAGGWSSNVVFVPAYNNGNAPFGQWIGAFSWVQAAWMNSRDFGSDIGGVVLQPLGGLKLSQRVGAFGFAWNGSPGKHWFSLGYPQAAPFDGKKMFACAASYAYGDGAFAPNPSGMGCDMTGGCSGGPWVWQLGGTGGYVNGVNSYRYGNRPEEMYSPFFGDAAKALRDCLVYSTPTTQKCTP